MPIASSSRDSERPFSLEPERGANFSRRLAAALSTGPHRGTLLVASLILIGFTLIAVVDFSHSTNISLGAFGSFWESGHALSHHLDPYAVYPRTPFFYDAFYTHRRQVSLNLTPPPLLPLFQLFSNFNPVHAAQLWSAISLLLFLSSMGLLWVEYGPHIQRRQIIWFLLGPGAIHTLLLAQDYALLTALIVLSWLMIEHEHPIAAGIFLGIFIVVKPNLALSPIFLFLCGSRRTAKSTIITALAACCVPAVLYGPQIYLQWLRAITDDPHWIVFTDVSFKGLASRLGVRIFGQIIAALVLLGTTLFVAIRKPANDIALGLAVTAGLLCSPLAWVSYSLFFAPFLLRRAWSWRFTLAIAPMMVPEEIAAIFAGQSRTTNLLASLLYFIPVCCIFVYFFRLALQVPATSPLQIEAAETR